ncbi:MAG: MFS transporter [Bacillota bacterium]
MCKQAKLLLVISALYTFAMGLSGIFVNVYFWKQTNDFKVIVLYNMIHYIATPIAFITGGAIAKKRNGIWSLRLGLLLYSIFYILILFYGNKGATYIYALGFIYGLAIGFYWLAFNTLSFDFTDVNNRDTFNGYNGSCAGVAAAISPWISGFIISLFKGMRGYAYVFGITFLIFLLLVLISTIISCKRYDSKLDIKTVLHGGCKDWNIIKWATVLWGFRDVVIVYIVNILIIETMKSELLLGKIILAGSLITSASYVLVQRIIKPPKRQLAVILGTAGSMLAVVLIAIKVNYLTILSYIVIDSFFIPFYIIQLTSATFNVISRARDEDLRIEYIINKDIALNAGRVLSSAVLFILLLLFDKDALQELRFLKFYLLFIGIAPLFSGILLRRLRVI